LRSTLKRAIDLMKRRNCYFAKYTKMVNIEPAAGKAKPISNTISQDAIDSRFSRLWSEGGNGTGSNTCRASVQFQDSKSADQRPSIKDTIHPSLHSVFSIGSPIDPESPCRGLRRSVGGYAREPEARSTRERFRLGSASDYLPLMGDTEGGLIRPALCS
jgi:hypothetical protein